MENWSKQQIADFKRFEELIKVRQNDYQNCARVLSEAVKVNSRRERTIKITLIILGALVTTKGVADQLMIPYEKNQTVHALVLICYTLFGLLITIFASLEAAFKYTEKAAGLRLLSAQIKTNIRRNMADHSFSYHNEEFEEAMNELKKIITDQNDQLHDIEDKSATFGIDLASKVQIDYSIPSYFQG